MGWGKIWMENKTKPWAKQKELLKEVVPTPERIVQTAKEIEHEMTKYLFILEYLTAGRVSEITGDAQRQHPGLTRDDFKVEIIQGRKFLIIDVPNRKNRAQKRKTIPVPLDRTHTKELCEILFNYLNGLPPGQPAIPFGRHRAYQLMTKHLEVNNHFIRHVRLTHAIQHDNLNDSLLVMLAGWSDSRPLKKYKHLRVEDLASRL